MEAVLIFFYKYVALIHMANSSAAKILTHRDSAKLHYPLPKSWTHAAGLLRRKKKTLERHLERVRREWDRRPSRS